MGVGIVSIIFSAAVLLIAARTPARSADSDTQMLAASERQLYLVFEASSEWSKVNRWLIEYEMKARKGSSQHMVMAISAPGELYLQSAHLTPDYPWQIDPYGQEYFVHQGATCKRFPFNRIFSEDRLEWGSMIPGSFFQNKLLPVMPAWLLTDYKAPIAAHSEAIIPPAEALRSGEYRLLPGSESIAGDLCHAARDLGYASRKTVAKSGD